MIACQPFVTAPTMWAAMYASTQDRRKRKCDFFAMLCRTLRINPTFAASRTNESDIPIIAATSFGVSVAGSGSGSQMA